MYEKLCAILDRLQRHYGYKCRAVGTVHGWGIQVDYIEEGARFDWYFPLDHMVLKTLSVDEIAEAVYLDCRSAIFELKDEEAR